MIAVLAAWLVWAPGAAAPVELRWDAPEGCPAETEVRTGVEALLGEPLTRPRARRMTVIATVQARAPGWSLRIFTITGEGTRERALRYEHECGVLTRAAMVLIATVVDPEVLGRLDPESLALATGGMPGDAGGPVGRPVGTEVPVEVAQGDEKPGVAEGPAEVKVVEVAKPAEVKVAEVAKPAEVERGVRPRGGVRVVGGLGWNDLPAVGGGVGVMGSVLLPRVRVELGGGVWPVRRARVEGTGSGADFLLWTITARACPVLRPQRRFELPICVGVEAGQVQVRGVSLVDGSDARAPWFAFVLAPAVVVRLTPAIGLWLAPELAVPVLRPEYRVDAGVLHRAGAVALRGVLGVEFRFPRIVAMDGREIGHQGRGRP